MLAYPGTHAIAARPVEPTESVESAVLLNPNLTFHNGSGRVLEGSWGGPGRGPRTPPVCILSAGMVLDNHFLILLISSSVSFLYDFTLVCGYRMLLVLYYS